MNPGVRWAPITAGVELAVAVILLVLGVRVALISPRFSDEAFLATTAVLGLVSTGLGLAIALHRPFHAVGPTLGLVGLIPVLLGLNGAYVGAATRMPGSVPVPAWSLALSTGAWTIIYVPAAVLMLIFPDGQLISRPWRWAVVGLVILPIVYIVDSAFPLAPFPRPYEHLHDPFPAPHGVWLVVTYLVQAVCLLGLLALLVVSFAALLVRSRRADARGRAQLKWLSLAGCFLPGTLLLCWLSYLVLGGPDLVGVGLVGLFLAIPVATAIAVLRHDLYDVDRALASTVTYGVVSAVLLAFFSLASVVGGLVAAHGTVWAAAAATALCAVALAPLRTLVAAVVDRRLYPQRRAALLAIGGLRAQIHAGVSRPEQLESVLASALDDPELRLRCVVPGAQPSFDEDAPTTSTTSRHRQAPVFLGDERIGMLSSSPRVSAALLREVADASALLVEVVRLRMGLTAALDDISASRGRLLQVGYAERRKLERDLHDGAQQRLVSLGMNLRVVQRHLHDETYDAGQLHDVFGHAVDELAGAVADLRQIAHGLRPSSLDDGLGPALSAMAGHIPLPIALEITPDALPDDVAATAYYVASEAITNAVKHSAAAQIGLRVSRDQGAVTVHVRDDGAGGATVCPGRGLSGLTDRVAAAGGALRVESPVGRGTVVEAVLPCG